MFERERCGVTGKVMYPTRDAAQAAMRGYPSKHGVKKIAGKKCAFCNSFHTSSGKRDARTRW